MKHKIFILAVMFVPFFVFAQITERKGWYASLGLSYGSYELDLYNYNSGSDSYADQKFSQPVLRIGIEKKSIKDKNKFVLDAGGELSGGFGLKTSGTISGPTHKEDNQGWSIGINGLVKAGYKVSDNIVPLAGLGPYFTSLQSGSGDDKFSSKIYGMRAYLGVDVTLNTLTITPNIHFGIASWGNSNRWIGSADNSQNGQPSLFEAGVTVAMKL